MREITFYILFILLSFSCQKKENLENKATKSDFGCEEITVKENLLTAVIELQDLQQYYEVQNILGQPNLVIENNSQIGFDPKIQKFSRPVLVLDSTEISQKNIKAYIKFEKIVLSEDSAHVVGKYDVQGLWFEVWFVKDRCSWEKVSSNLLET